MLIKIRFLPFFLFISLIIVRPSFAAESIGQVADLRGEVWITTMGQKPTPAKFKQSIYIGDTIETKATGAVKILFIDDTLLTLKENSKTLITEFLFNPKAKQRKAVFNVLFGKIRTVVGKFFGQDQPVEIQTPVAIAGIRGTDVGALVKKKLTVWYCFEGSFEAYNIKFPEQIRKVTEGMSTKVFENLPPSELAPIPSDILDNKRELFDISLSPKSETKGEKSAGTQISQSASKDSATEVAKATVVSSTTTASAEGTQAGECHTSLLSCGGLAAEQESFVGSTTPIASTSSSSQTAEILPGGLSEVTNKATITITLPTP